ncbi:MAG: ROK family protein, partial [Promicromonosporaceae bacterium]|nr:ROK family protein [Promicromonosporaceae bacterium]
AAGLDPEAPVTDFIAALEAGDERVSEALDAAIIALAQVLSNVITLVDIRHLVVDGELAPLLPWLPGGMERLVADRLIAGHKIPLTNHRAIAGDLGPALGGALLALQGY